MNLTEVNKIRKWQKRPDGYYRAMIDCKLIYRHRFIWIMNYGEIPDGYEIDHINRVRGEDFISNLRLVTPIQNHLNEYRHQKSNTSIYKGVGLLPPSMRKNRKKHWRVEIRFKKYDIHYLKMFETEKEAALDYNRFMYEDLPKEISLEHDLIGNVAGRFIPYLNLVL